MPMKPSIHRLPPHQATLHAERRQRDRQRGSPSQRGYNRRWMKASRWFLLQHPLCVECQRAGRVEAATVVDHVVPHRGNHALFWNTSNWQGLCAMHHSVKTAKYDGGFGNRRRDAASNGQQDVKLNEQ